MTLSSGTPYQLQIFHPSLLSDQVTGRCHHNQFKVCFLESTDLKARNSVLHPAGHHHLNAMSPHLHSVPHIFIDPTGANSQHCPIPPSSSHHSTCPLLYRLQIVLLKTNRASINHCCSCPRWLKAAPQKKHFSTPMSLSNPV